MTASVAHNPRASRALGLLAAAVIAAIYITVALWVQIPKDTGTFSDEWTYAMMATSLAKDGDLVYREAEVISSIERRISIACSRSRLQAQAAVLRACFSSLG